MAVSNMTANKAENHSWRQITQTAMDLAADVSLDDYGLDVKASVDNILQKAPANYTEQDLVFLRYQLMTLLDARYIERIR